jgi:hypothetical protein
MVTRAGEGGGIMETTTKATVTELHPSVSRNIEKEAIPVYSQ